MLAAVLFRRDTKAFQDVVEGEGCYALLCIPNGVPLDGGVLLKSGNEIIGAVGASGATDEDDGDIGRAGASVIPSTDSPIAQGSTQSTIPQVGTTHQRLGEFCQ